MNLAINPKTVVWDTFGGLEPPKPEWKDQISYWEDYAEKFFKSNGMTFKPEDSNVENWLMSDDRAPFADMVGELLPRLEDVADLEEIDAILFAHWLPDIHLGTSVTNYAMHKLGLKNCLGFAISDRGLSAPFFAFDALYKFLINGRKRGLLIISDQKHTMYKSDIIEEINPHNTTCIVPLDLSKSEGLKYKGYRRAFIKEGQSPTELIKDLMVDFDLPSDQTVVIGPRSITDDPAFENRRITTNERLVCTAPFAAFADIENFDRNYVLLCLDGNCISALGFEARVS